MKKQLILPYALAAMVAIPIFAADSCGTLPGAKTAQLCIIMPAYNEEQRIGSTLESYYAHFGNRAIIKVILNGCSDNTKSVVESSKGYSEGAIQLIELEQAGKGHAVKHGFQEALSDNCAVGYIGFVDADGATAPKDFEALVSAMHLDPVDGVIASRYMDGAISTERPFIKKWGQRLCFLPLVRCLFGIDYHDTQCGAKIFKRNVIESIAHQMREPGWSFDVELLYLAAISGFNVVEVPTQWEDQAGSHLDSCGNGIPMLFSLCAVRANYAAL